MSGETALVSDHCVTESGAPAETAVDADLAELLAAWPMLSADVRRAVLAVVRGTVRQQA